jgi:hydroxyacylglutathione hydrolase
MSHSLIEVFPSGPLDTNAYVVCCPQTLQAGIIDPAPQSADAIIEYLKQNQCVPKKILLTHSHWDHIADTAMLKKTFNIPVGIHPLDRSNLENPGSDRLPFRLSIESVRPDFLMVEGDLIDIGNLQFEVIHTPGHTPGGICLYCKEMQILFSGDTLFQGTIGKLTLPTGQPELMWNSLDKLSKLPKETQVLPGHGPSTTIGKESWLKEARNYFG